MRFSLPGRPCFALDAGWPAIGIAGAALAALLNGLGEETGWRAFLLPGAQDSSGPALARSRLCRGPANASQVAPLPEHGRRVEPRRLVGGPGRLASVARRVMIVVRTGRCRSAGRAKPT